MEFNIIQSLDQIANSWNELYHITPEISPFLNSSAFKIAKKYFYPYYIRQRKRPAFIVFSDQGVIQAIIPVLRHKKTNGDFYEIFGNANGFNECGILYRDSKVLKQCITQLKEAGMNLRFIKIDERSPISEFKTVNSKTTNNVEIHFKVDFDIYFKSLSSSVRQNIRTAYNRLNKDGLTYSLEVFQPKDGCNRFPTKEIIDLYCRRHSERYGVETSFLKKWFLRNQSFATRLYKYADNALTTLLRIEVSRLLSSAGFTAKTGLLYPDFQLTACSTAILPV